MNKETHQQNNLEQQPKYPFFNFRESFETTYFYSIDSRGLPVRGDLAAANLQIIKPLKFEKDVKNIENHHMFLCQTTDGQKVKARFCFSPRDAARIEQNVQLAHAKGVSTPQVISRQDSLVVLEYIEGANVADMDISQYQALGKLHAQLIEPFSELAPAMHAALSALLVNILQRLQPISTTEQMKRLEDLITQLYPKTILPVFDHQDTGRHNTVLDEQQNLWLIDEEAFGIVPFGYTQERFQYGLDGLGTCQNDEQRGAYLSQFSAEHQDYYLATRTFWQLVLQLRTAGRYMILNRPEVAKSHLERTLQLS